ncbi:hypothetical protein SAMN05421770_1011199 [Granulicella rosea]|uniref:4-amino-4-deoxy-L-arabinose transferase n=1 Tax=Granulicella rosea TaxID=474952 RepID=A0A239EYJ3_9BACT|nr:hypothetical protein [Granulicella rosea]SNS49103.1 hypothetical protein SAMN05421770_1011199 [Granulicella rosea]
MAGSNNPRKIPPAAIVTALTAYVLLVVGYHPDVEDGGLYIAGIKRLLHPALYPHGTEFVTEHLRFSLFAPLVAGLIHATRLSLDWVLLLLYLASIWATLYAGWMIAVRTVDTLEGRWGAVTLLACWLSLPIAGTSLMLMDPYVTARSITLPCSLIALAGILDLLRAPHAGPVAARRTKAWALTTIPLILAAVLHPLMAGYALAGVLLLACFRANSPDLRRQGPIVLFAAALLAATVLQSAAPPESADYLRVALTRYYWFPGQWELYERIGLAAPLALIGWLSTRREDSAWKALGRMALALAGIALLIASIFARPSLATHLAARMQPLRSYQTIYLVMILMLGAWAGETLLKRSAWRWLALLAGFGGLLFFVQRNVFPASAHLELPWRQPRNPWVRAFVWTRENTPQDALFAMDAHYITRDGEDAQSFRAIAERSALPDYSKDGGEASITPGLTPQWVVGQAAQTDLDRLSDEARIARLRPLHVDWLILRAGSQTAFPCPYTNDTVKVCRLPTSNP